MFSIFKTQPRFEELKPLKCYENNVTCYNIHYRENMFEASALEFLGNSRGNVLFLVVVSNRK